VRGAVLPDPASLRAISVALEPRDRFDPLALAAGDGVLFAGRRLAFAGRRTAVELPLPGGLERGEDLTAARRWLAHVPHDDRVGRVGSSVTAFGALAFDRSAAGHLLVPELTFVRDAEGRQWVTLVVPSSDPPTAVSSRVEAELATARRPSSPFTRSTRPEVRHITPVPDRSVYEQSVVTALAEVDAGRLRKVVLARSVDVRFAGTVPVARALRRLHEQEPTCTVFAVPIDGGRFVGASPELLVRRRGEHVTAHPLAGTMAIPEPGTRAERKEIQQFLASSKDRLEHEIVVDAVVATLRSTCADIELPEHPSLVRLHSVAHLGTMVRGTLRAGDDRPSVLDLVASLHPTPAVGGTPSTAALACILALEPVPRGHWAGPVGWMDAAGDGDWFIGIRSATVLGATVTLSAGAGIVTGSRPKAEFEETSAKLAPVLEAFAPGAGRRL